MTGCTAINCSNRDVPENRQKGMTFHKFPLKTPQLLEQWIANMKRIEPNGKVWTPTKSMKLCSAHFTPDCFDRTGQTTRLRANAVPTIFNFPMHLVQKTSSRTSTTEAEASLELDDLPAPLSPPSTAEKAEALMKLDDLPAPPSPPSTSFREHTYANCQSPRVLKRLLNVSEERREKLQKQLKCEVQKKRRLQEKVKRLSSVIDSLKEKGLISKNS